MAVEQFVMGVFAQTDKSERTDETIGKKHAVDFNRAGHFINVISCFGELSPEWANRSKYCKYKAGTIMKALKAGEQPERGNPFEPEEDKPKEEAKQEETAADMIAPVNPPQPVYQP